TTADGTTTARWHVAHAADRGRGHPVPPAHRGGAGSVRPRGPQGRRAGTEGHRCPAAIEPGAEKQCPILGRIFLRLRVLGDVMKIYAHWPMPGTRVAPWVAHPPGTSLDAPQWDPETGRWTCCGADALSSDR